MKKCKCIKESSWFLIDDSFDGNSNIKGGRFSFIENDDYYYFVENTAFGKCFSVIHPKHGKENPVGFSEEKFLENFKILENE
jgi:hypothetical protein